MKYTLDLFEEFGFRSFVSLVFFVVPSPLSV
jgi:hypothetical protein